MTLNSPYPNQVPPFTNPGHLMTSGMALAEPSIEEFLQNEEILPQIDVFWEHVGQAGLY